MKRRGTQLLILAFLATAVALVGPTASAAGETVVFNGKTQFLAAQPTEGMATACTSSRVTLFASIYDWSAEYYSYPTDEKRKYTLRNLRLGTGTYTWTDCLKPMNGYYLHTSTLDPDNPAWQTASASGILHLDDFGSSGQTWWGTSLWTW